MRKFTKFALISTLISGFALSAVAAPNDAHHDGQRFMERHFAGLNLTEQQKTEIQKIIETRKNAVDAKTTDETDRLANRKALMDLALSEQFDEAKAKSLIGEKNSKNEERIIENLRTQNEIYKLLTPEQRTTLTKNIEERQAKRAEKGEHSEKGHHGNKEGHKKHGS